MGAFSKGRREIRLLARDPLLALLIALLFLSLALFDFRAREKPPVRGRRFQPGQLRTFFYLPVPQVVPLEQSHRGFFYRYVQRGHRLHCSVHHDADIHTM